MSSNEQDVLNKKLYDAVPYQTVTNIARIINSGADVNYASRYYTVLGMAAMYGKFDTVEYLVMAGADLNKSTGHDSLTPVMQAIEKNHPHIVKYLLKQGADIDLQGIGGNTALHLACRQDKFEMIEILLRENARTDIRNNKGETVLDLVAKSSNDQLKALFENPPQQPSSGFKP